MAEQKWTLETTQALINSGDFSEITETDFVEMDKVLRQRDLVADDIIVTARSYLSEAAEGRIAELSDKNLSETTAEDLDSIVALLERFSSYDAEGYKGKAAEVMKRVEARREVIKKQQEEADFLNKVENLTPAELWERRKKLQQENTPQALEENKKLEDFVLAKAEKLAKGEAFIADLTQAQAVEALLEDISAHPLNDRNEEQRAAISQTLEQVKELVADMQEQSGLDGEPREEDFVDKNLEALERMPSDEDLFKRGNDGKLSYPEFEDIDNILSNMQVEGELTVFGRKKVKQEGEESDIALFRQQIRLETEMFFANKAPEEVTEEAFRAEYAARLNQGIFEVAYANEIAQGKLDKKDMQQLIARLSKSAAKGKPVSVHQDVLVGWQAAHAVRNEAVVRSMEERGQKKAAMSFKGRIAALADKCQKRYPNTYSKIKGLVETAGWGAAYGVASSLGPLAPAGIACVATASFARSGWKFYKSYKKAKEQAAGKGKNLGFWKYVKNNKMQAAGVLLSATAAVTGGLSATGFFEKSPELLAGITQLRATSGISLALACTAKQMSMAYKKGGWKAAAKAGGMSLLSFGVGFISGRAAGQIAGEVYERYVNSDAEVPVEAVKNVNTESETKSVIANGQNEAVVKTASNVENAQGNLNNVTQEQSHTHTSPLGNQAVGQQHNGAVHDQSDISASTGESVLPSEVHGDVSQEWRVKPLDVEISDKPIGLDVKLAEINPDDIKIPGHIGEEVKPLFTPEGVNEDGSLYGTTPGGRQVSDFVIDENGKILSMTVDGKEFDDARLAQINDHPDYANGLEERALATQASAKELFSENLTAQENASDNEAVVENMDEYLEGEWQEHQVQAPETNEMPGSPMTAEEEAAVQTQQEAPITSSENEGVVSEVNQEMPQAENEVAPADEGLVQNMDEYLEGEWQEYQVHAPETNEMPGTPMTVAEEEAALQTQQEAPITSSENEGIVSDVNQEMPQAENETVSVAAVDTNGWKQNANGVEIDPNPDRPTLLQVHDRASTLGWSDGENLKNGQFIQEPDAKGNLQILGRDESGHLYKLTANDVGVRFENGMAFREDSFSLDLPPNHPSYNALNARMPAGNVTGAERAAAIGDYLDAGEKIDKLTSKICNNISGQTNVTGHVPPAHQSTNQNVGQISSSHDR